MVRIPDHRGQEADRTVTVADVVASKGPGISSPR